MDPDIPQPSIETDDHGPGQPPDLQVDGSTTSNDQTSHSNQSLLSASTTDTATPTSPVRSLKSPTNIQRNGTPTQPGSTISSPARRVSTSSPLRPERRSSTPLAQGNAPLGVLRNSTQNPPPGRSPTAMSVRSVQWEEEVPRRPTPPTAASVAQEHFAEELEGHSTSAATKTVVILHDACYGHRFSRPRATKAQLSTIVERPERILASVLGLSAAYVRLGERHDGGRYSPKLGAKLATAPPFKIHKTSRIMPLSSAAATQVHGQKWMEELKIMCDTAESKLATNGKELARPEGMDKEEDGTPRPKLHEGDLYLCSESIDALQGCLGGVCEGVDSIFKNNETKRAFVCVRPPGHHCSSDYPSGFCWLNNVHVGISYAAMTHGLTHAAIIDFDLHHGDGSQAVAWDHNARAATLPKNAAAHKKTPIGYYSLHDINSYPCEFGDEEKVRSASLCIENAHGQSIWNVHLEEWKTQEDFWRLYETRYLILLEKARVFLRHHTARLKKSFNGPTPKAAIFLSAGFDASEWEGAGMQRHKVNVLTDFYARFTADVVKMSEEEGLGVDGRVISVLEGGYSDRALTSGVLSHICGLVSGSSPAQAAPGSMSLEKQMEMLGVNGQTESAPQYDVDWWAPHNLEAIEALVNNVQLPPPKKMKDHVPGNYSSPTMASSARSMSGTHGDRKSFTGEVGVARHMLPLAESPPPKVDWATAAVELSRLLIPKDRTTVSCRHDELNAEATRARKARQSAINFATTDAPAANGDVEPKMQLRERKARIAAQPPPPARTSSRASRRKTIAAMPEPEETPKDGTPEDPAARAPSRSQRRVSDASSIISGFSNMQLDDRLEMNDISNSTSRDLSAAPGNIQASVEAPVVKKARPTSMIGRVKAPSSGRASPASVATMSSSVNSQKSSTTQAMKPPAQPASTTNSSGTSSADVDALASSVGKLRIHLKVPSPEENAAREKERSKAQVKEKKPRAPRKPAVPKAIKPIVPKKETKTTPKPIDPVPLAPAIEPVTKPEVQSTVLPANQPVTQPLQTTGITVPPAFTETSQGPGFIPSPSDIVPVAQPPLSDPIPAPDQTMSGVVENQTDVPGVVLPVLEQQLQAQAEPIIAADAPPQQPASTGISIDQLIHAHTTNPEPVSSSLSTNDTNTTSIPNPEIRGNGIQPEHPNPTMLAASNQIPDTHTEPPQLEQSSIPSAVQTSPPFSPASPNSKRTRAELPVFTSSSTIPFAKPSTIHKPSMMTYPTSMENGQSANAGLFQHSNIDVQHPSNATSDTNDLKKEEPSKELDIWDVPVTP